MRENFVVTIYQEDDNWFCELTMEPIQITFKYETREAAYAIKTLLKASRRVQIRSHTESNDE